MKADLTTIPALSDRAVAAIGAVAQAKTDKERSDAAKAIAAAPEIKREIEAFKVAVVSRFGEDGVRTVLREASAGQSFEHASVSREQQDALGFVATLYWTVRKGESGIAQSAERERTSQRQSRGPKQTH